MSAKCLLVSASILALAGLGPAAAGGTGEAGPVQTRPQAPPSRIVSLVPAVTEALFEIGAGSRLVGVSSFDDHPPEVARITRVGGLIDPDVERILSLAPDLVVIYATQSDLRQQLQRAGLPLFEYEHAGLADVTATIRALGRRTSLVQEAERVATRIERKLDAVRARTRALPHPSTLLVFGRQPGTLTGLYASGGVGFLHDMLEIAGGANVFADIRRQSVQASSELILARSPQVIVELRSGEPRSDTRREPDRAAWNALSAVAAVRDGRVFVLEGTEFVIPGPRVASATERLARLLHPEAFAGSAPGATAARHQPSSEPSDAPSSGPHIRVESDIIRTMKQISIQDLKARLSGAVSEAESGITIVITRHGEPVAQLSSARPPHVHRGRGVGTGRIKPAVTRGTGGRYLAVLMEDRGSR